MQIWCRRRRRPSLSWLAGWILTGGMSATACSGEVGVADTDSTNNPLNGDDDSAMMPPAMNDLDDGGDDSDAPPAMPTEGNPNTSGLDASGMDDGTQQPVESMDDPVPQSPDVPATAYCEDVANWDPEWVQFEEDVLLLVNENRSRAADCGVEGMFAASAPVTTDPILRCSARLHSLDMFDRDFFDHVNPDGIDPFQRMAAAGFVGNGGGENIALGQVSPEEVMEAWMDSDGHCANVMRASFTTIGVGYHPGAGQRGLGSNYWTQNFGAPSRGGTRNR